MAANGGAAGAAASGSIAALRAKLADQWSAMDADGDGVIEGSDLMAGLDTNKDGVLDKAEVEKLATQLQEQSDYTAYLITQMQRLEEAQLAAQKDAAEKQAALRHTLAVCDKTRSEANELARRLDISQEVLQKMSEQARQARVDAGIAQREAENLREQYVESVCVCVC